MPVRCEDVAPALGERASELFERVRNFETSTAWWETMDRLLQR